MADSDQELTNTPTIVIVEDDESTGEVLSMMIAQETPYFAQLVTNGQDALHFIRQNVPQLLIFDYRLPDTTGVELYDKVRCTPGLQNIPVILMSATHRQDEIEPRDLIMIEKPFELDNLLATIESLLHPQPPSTQAML